MKFSNNVDQNTYKAYISRSKYDRNDFVNLNQRPIDTFSLKWDDNNPEPLSTICIRIIAKYWSKWPIFKQIQAKEDQHFLLHILDVQHPLSLLCETIHSDIFWKRCFQSRWTNFYPHSLELRPWISLYIERFLGETLESIKPSDWNDSEMIQLALVCSPYVHRLSVGQLCLAINEDNDHIRIDTVLRKLDKLCVLELSYSIKSIGTEYILGCSNLSQNDIKWLSVGLETCNELVEFR